MIKQVLNHFNASLCAELSLALFAMVFVAVILRTLCTSGKVTDRQARVVLDDQGEELR